MSSRSKRSLIGLAGTVLALAACSPIVEQRGYVADPDRMAAIKANVDTRDSVQAALGTPSTVSPFDDSTWYYVSSTMQHYAFQDPHVTKRDVVAIHFDKTGTVDRIDRYDAKDGRDVAMVDRKTPTKGKELTFLQQMFGNFSRLNPGASGPDRATRRTPGAGQPGGP